MSQTHTNDSADDMKLCKRHVKHVEWLWLMKPNAKDNYQLM